MLGLVGAHRVGKSTLAREYAKKHGWTFAETSVSAIFKELGHNPSEVFDFKTRLTIQEQVLIRMNEFYKKSEGSSVITDRTPIDMIAYTMAEAVGDAVLPEDQVRFARYINDCFSVTNRWFSEIIVVQPGIPLVQAEGKAALNEAYMAHLNSLIIGLCCDERLKASHFYIPKHRLEIEHRIESIDAAKQKSMERVLLQRGNLEKAEFH